MSMRRDRIIIAVTIGSSLILSALLVFLLAGVGQFYNPFGVFPVQKVISNQPIPMGTPVAVVGTKCYTEPVTIRGQVSWRLVSPVTAIVQAGTGQADRNLGCLEQTFRNAWPERAVELSKEVARDFPGEPILWQITGWETPVKGGVTQVWATENFEIIVGG